MTLGTLLKQGREILQNTGIAEWDLDAWYLLEYVTGVSRSQYFLDPERDQRPGSPHVDSRSGGLHDAGCHAGG